MNVALLQNEKTAAEPLQASGNLHAALSDAPDEKAVAGLLEVAENEEQKRRVLQKVAWFFALSCVFSIGSLVVSSLVELMFTRSAWLQWASISTTLLVICFGHLFVFFAKSRKSPRKRLQNAVAGLLEFPDDPRFLLPFVDGLNTEQTPEWKTRLYPVLTKCLWNLFPTDAVLSFDDTRRATLRTALSNAYYGVRPAAKREANAPDYFDEATTDLAVALIKTLAGMGDKKSVKVLQKIIKAEAVTPHETVICDAAREYLPVLTQKIDESKFVQQKLRECLVAFLRDPLTVLAEFLDTLDPEKAKVALVEFIHEQQHEYDFLGVLMSASSIVAGLAFVLRGLLHGAGTKSGQVRIAEGLIFLFFGIGLSLCFAVGNGFGKQNRKMANVLNRRTESENDLRLISLLLLYTRDGHIFNDPSSNDAAKKSLVRLLPLLRSGDAALVPPDARTCLRAWLKMPRSKKKMGSTSQTLAIVALNALAAIGDTKALPAAEKIARQTLRGNYHETELHEAAVRCVEVLRTRKS